jgi:hypothetical protein
LVPTVLRYRSARLDRKGVRLFRHAKVPNLKKPQHTSLVSHSTLNRVLMCSAHTSDSKSTDWTTEGLWFTSRQQEESLPFEVSPARIKGYSGRGVMLNTHIFQLPMLLISGASCMLTVPTQKVLHLPFVPEHGITSSLRNALRFLARDDRQVTKKIRRKYCQIPSSEYFKPS